MSGQSPRSPLWTHTYSHLWTGRRLFFRKACFVRWVSFVIQHCAIKHSMQLYTNDDYIVSLSALEMGIRHET